MKRILEQVQLPVSDAELTEIIARQHKGMTYQIPVGIPRKEPVRQLSRGLHPRDDDRHKKHLLFVQLSASKRINWFSNVLPFLTS